MRGKKTRVLVIRLSPVEREMIHAAAFTAGKSMSEFVRANVFAAVEQEAVRQPVAETDADAVGGG